MKPEFTYIEQFINRIDVECPSCKAKAVVTSSPENRAETRFTCVSCGSTKNWMGKANVFQTGSSQFFSGGILMGHPIDCYFKYPLWYTTEVKGKVLFGYNKEHLTYLLNFISNKTRERQPNEHGWSNRSLESRLPKWMLSAKNREVIEKKLKELMAKGV
ncbi:hypothetical protein EV198_0872 [Roseivirga ehrenbergii]|uniref:Uncharacterized protein n=1 Tax=Roseivirga ehrenbergii (strain DSM 102268 / JCM 13514 / KCTC 12282 / NCIMB 14502 / KMM 6017) TaxID=279360 RepID=A0A150X7K7_ROSEK|nr:hypothetical protein [Roseivirga ehrenbergii]KYG74642.1 hypothetical protein MB14_05400 [Roseivirga ehrenbergii]TCL14036.1 hypothetical protein EV198_0872 [Roseivirga ehrenbergii]